MSLIHFVGYASQPYVYLFCDEQSAQYVWAGDSGAGDPKVFKTSDGRLYTFDETKVTCRRCLGRRLNPGSEGAREKGCSCPTIDNAHGKGIEGRFVFNLLCPLHGERAGSDLLR